MSGQARASQSSICAVGMPHVRVQPSLPHRPGRGIFVIRMSSVCTGMPVLSYRCSDLEHRLEASTSECQRAQRYTEVLKRGLAGAAGALAAGESLEDLLRRVALDVMEPAHQELHAAKMEVLQLKQELDTARDQVGRNCIYLLCCTRTNLCKHNFLP